MLWLLPISSSREKPDTCTNSSLTRVIIPLVSVAEISCTPSGNAYSSFVTGKLIFIVFSTSEELGAECMDLYVR